MSDISRVYENYLDYRRQESTFLWVSRKIHPQYAHKQTNRPTPESHKEAVLKSIKIQDLITQICETQMIPKDELERKVRLILDEIGYNRKPKLIRWLGLVLNQICLTVCSGIQVNKYKVQEVKLMMGDCPVVFVPSHRSYVDFILMSYVCFAYDIAIPAIAAGMDFHGMVGMGNMLRNTGAFFMRRSYNDDSLYWSTFKQYIYQLVTKGDLPIEFFIEGTRSRSNKSLLPKYGLFSMILKAFFLGQVPDIMFVPINFSYDRIFEESLFAFELLGVPKPKESTSGFFKSLKILKEHFGNVYIHFDTPISAKQFFGDKLDRTVHTKGPVHLQEVTENEKSLMPRLGHEIVYRQQKSSVITIFNLISVIVNDNLINANKLTNLKLIEEVHWLKNIMETFDAYVHVDISIKDGINEAFVVHSNLIQLDGNHNVQLVTNKVTQDNINPKKMKAHGLSDKTMTYATPFVMLQIYINATLHYLVDAAFIVCILDKDKALNKDELFLNFNFLRSLYLMEFVAFSSRVQMEFESALWQTVLLNVVQEGVYYKLSTNDKLKRLLLNSITPFLHSYIVIISLLENSPIVCEEKVILASVQEVLEMVINENKEFIHPYCLNLDTALNCLSNLSSLRVLKNFEVFEKKTFYSYQRNTTDGHSNQNVENRNFYEIDKEKLIEIKNKLEVYIPPIDFSRHILKMNHLQNKL